MKNESKQGGVEDFRGGALFCDLLHMIARTSLRYGKFLVELSLSLSLSPPPPRSRSRSLSLSLWI